MMVRLHLLAGFMWCLMASCQTVPLEPSSPLAETQSVSAANTAVGQDGALQSVDMEWPSVYRRLEWGGFHPGPYQEGTSAQLEQAVKRFQEFAQLAVTGVIDKPTWNAMRRLHDPGYSRPPRAVSPSVAWPQGVILSVQSILGELGYAVSAISDRFDSSTQSALQQFQRDHQISGTDALSPITLLALAEARCQKGCVLNIAISSSIAPTKRSVEQTLSIIGPSLKPLLINILRALLKQQGDTPDGTEEAWDVWRDTALRHFQAKYGLTTHGKLNQETLLGLLAASCPSGCQFRLTVKPTPATG